MKELKKNDPIKARRHSNIFRIVIDLNTTNDGAEFESHCCNIFLEELELGKESIHKHEDSFLNRRIKIKDEKF